MKKTKRTFKVKVIRFFQDDTIQLILPWVGMAVSIYFFIKASN